MRSLAAEFAQMALDLQDQPDVAETLASITSYAQESLDADHAGIHVVHGREIETAAATDPVIEHADKMQTELGEGPCLQAVWSHDSFLVHDTATDERWPRFGPLAAQLGLHSMLSVRLFTAEQTLGALNLYSTSLRDFDGDDIALAHIFGQHASVAIAAARREEGLRLAVDARHLIGQAQGILMERFGLSADQAFAVLRRYSQENNVKLRAVAAEIIETRRLPTA
jgi:GAF domain-containing protein